jgi:type IV pilus assembly protein PilY1
VIVITDGMGNTGTTVANVGSTTQALNDYGVNVVGIGFGLAEDETEQLYKLAEVSNDNGDYTTTDDLYALHQVFDGVPAPFICQSKEELVNALHSITSSIKAEVFHGSAPAPTTSVDYGDIVITAKFQPSDWSGDLVAAQYNADIGAIEEEAIWSVVEEMPDTIDAFTVMSDMTDVIPYETTTLPTDSYICTDKKLSDIIDSTPIIVESPTYNYNFDNYLKGFKYVVDRDPLVYVGANDGALHTFRLINELDENGEVIHHGGQEVWRFYPTAVHENLNKAQTDAHWNMCDEETYCHRYYVDGSPIAADIFDGTNWKTMLTCGLREGGEAYFALDITSGKAFDDPTDPSEFMWEFTDTELGQTWNEPAIARVNKNGGGAAWGVFFGSGYKELQTEQATKQAYLYGIEAHNKDPLWGDDGSGNPDTNRIKISSTDLYNDALSSPMVADIEGGYLGDFIYTGNLYGSMYRVKNIGKGMEPVVTKLYDSGDLDNSTPIRAAADYGYAAESDQIWVYFGSGRYETQVDKYNSTKQYFFGLKDSTAGTTTYTLTDLTYIEAGYTVDNGKTYRTLTLDEGDYKGESWVIGLDDESPGLIGSERVISQPLAVGGIVFFTSFIPDIDVCAGSGTAWLFAVDMQTGMTPAEPVFDINADGIINELDKIESGAGMVVPAGIFLGLGQPSKPVLLRDILFANTTAGGLTSTVVSLDARLTKLQSWREQ